PDTACRNFVVVVVIEIAIDSYRTRSSSKNVLAKGNILWLNRSSSKAMDHANKRNGGVASCGLRRAGAWLICLALIFGVGCDRMPPPLEREAFPIPEGAAEADGPVGQFGGILTMNTGSEPRTFNPLIVED